MRLSEAIGHGLRHGEKTYMCFQYFRRHTVAALALGLAISTPAVAQSSSDGKTQAAYELAMKCFVASGHAEFDRRDAHDLEGASRYEGKASRAHDIANKLGEQLGYSGDRIADDYKAAMDRELPRLMNQPGYFARVSAECRAYGLM
ncbi:hypothetical protein [Asticcacaulis sp. EMRT-3]|uniref:hypothetical protein n=1 Tax=Asticcacaulis sp. EMRT-3 TaxID=3040349 RepID=UPI0024AED89C|nr:hypothetical protein [Asticcacaulis sp. EMRT-3]MDI7774678.1 hypothetical protein [Asticcacaulis sp. EMRT-3]